MKIFDKIILVLFSFVILILSVMMCLLLFGWAKISLIDEGLYYVINNDMPSKIALGISLLLIIISIKSIVFSSNSKKDVLNKEGILLENDNGKLVISRDTIENLVSSIAKEFEGAQNITTKVILDRQNNIIINVTLFVEANTIIKDLSNKLQTRIKEVIKAASDLEIKEVNVRIKNIVQQPKTVQTKEILKNTEE